jgi:hypothetical protein
MRVERPTRLINDRGYALTAGRFARRCRSKSGRRDGADITIGGV